MVDYFKFQKVLIIHLFQFQKVSMIYKLNTGNKLLKERKKNIFDRIL